MGFGNVTVSFVYTLLYETQLVFLNLVASAAVILRRTMALLCDFYSLTTSDDNYKIWNNTRSKCKDNQSLSRQLILRNKFKNISPEVHNFSLFAYQQTTYSLQPKFQ